MNGKNPYAKSPVIPAILTTDAAEFTKKLEFARQSTQSVHVDVIDGEFCHGHTLPVKEWPELKIDYAEAHLMVKQPVLLFEELAKKGVTRNIVHIEVAKDLEEIRAKARENDLLLGFAVNPDTDLLLLKPVLETNAYIQVMGVQPGASGQAMQDQTDPAVRYLRRSVMRRIIITVDGGVNQDNIAQLKLAGADYFVESHGLYVTDDWARNYGQMMEAVR